MEEVKFAKLVTGETVMGIYNDNTNYLEGVALIQMMPSADGAIQMAIVPYGFPFEEKISGKISADNILYEFEHVPEDLKSKYLQAKSNITISSSMPQAETGSGNVLDLENILKKH